MKNPFLIIFNPLNVIYNPSNQFNFSPLLPQCFRTNFFYVFLASRLHFPFPFTSDGFKIDPECLWGKQAEALREDFVCFAVWG
jgi:hypothetical protein